MTIRHLDSLVSPQMADKANLGKEASPTCGAEVGRGCAVCADGYSLACCSLLLGLTGPRGQKTNVTLISAYAPTMTNPNEIKDRFYEELDSLIASVPKSERLVILGDFNARVGTDHQAWHRTIGKHGVGKCDSNGLLLLRLCASHDLVITNTMNWVHLTSNPSASTCN
ncbi:hypothetical protein ACROYT_G016634 [Oculina patagonica]